MEQPYLSTGASRTEPVQTGVGVPELISCVPVQHLFSSTTPSTFISSILPALVHLLQSDAELGEGSNHLQHVDSFVKVQVGMQKPDDPARSFNFSRSGGQWQELPLLAVIARQNRHLLLPGSFQLLS